MKKRTAFYIVLWLAALVVCLMLLDGAMRRDDGERKYGEFFASETGFDVLFMGTSRVLNGISPMELWREHGITAFNMGNNSEVMAVTTEVMRLAFDIHKPKIAMIDVFYVNHAVDEAWTYPYRHMFFDEIPLSMAKFDAIRATLPESEWTEFLMPFSLYHGRWEELVTGPAEPQVLCEPYMMGLEPRIGRVERRPYPRTDAVYAGDLPGLDAIRDMVALCRGAGVEPVLMTLPGYATEENQTMMNAALALGRELGVTVLDLHAIDETAQIVDLMRDSYDWVGHLNPDGAKKTTAWIGRWLAENYALADHRGGPGSERWEENLKKYDAYLAENWD